MSAAAVPAATDRLGAHAPASVGHAERLQVERHNRALLERDLLDKRLAFESRPYEAHIQYSNVCNMSSSCVTTAGAPGQEDAAGDPGAGPRGARAVPLGRDPLRRQRAPDRRPGRPGTRDGRASSRSRCASRPTCSSSTGEVRGAEGHHRGPVPLDRQPHPGAVRGDPPGRVPTRCSRTFRWLRRWRARRGSSAWARWSS